jgi:hypothetical protein
MIVLTSVEKSANWSRNHDSASICGKIPRIDTKFRESFDFAISFSETLRHVHFYIFFLKFVRNLPGGPGPRRQQPRPAGTPAAQRSYPADLRRPALAGFDPAAARAKNAGKKQLIILVDF